MSRSVALSDHACAPDVTRRNSARPAGIGRAVIALIEAYRRHAPRAVRASCRYDPTCSEYAILAIQRYGAPRGGLRAFRRFMRCRPPYGGVDQP
jgi:putative membrane protein insertion efficiency factor